MSSLPDLARDRGEEKREKKGKESFAENAPPEVTVVDTTAAGDTFTAALVVALMEEQEPAAALAFACTAAASTQQAGAQPTLPRRSDVAAAGAQHVVGATLAVIFGDRGAGLSGSRSLDAGMPPEFWRNRPVSAVEKTR